MAKKRFGIKMFGTLALLGGGFFLVRHFWRKATQKAINAALLHSGTLSLSQDSSSIQVVDSQTGDIFSTYEFTGNDMPFPLSHDPSMAYDNVAKLQAYLLFANADLNMPIDGRFGDLTAEAVYSEVDGLTDYGYDAEDYDYETITQEYYNEVVIPELQYYLSEE
jgi:hypothetical protein